MRRRRQHWGFGDVAPDSATQVALQTESDANTAPQGAQIHTAANQLKQQMIVVAVEIAAVQLTMAVLLDTVMFVVPIGTIIGAILSIIDIFTGAYAKRKIKEIIADAVSKIHAETTAVQADLQQRAAAIAAQEWPNAQALAASGAALSGLDGWWQDAVHDFTHSFTKAQGAVLKTVVQVTSHSLEDVLHLLGDSKDANKIAKQQQNWNRWVNQWGQNITVVMNDPKPKVLVADLVVMPTRLLFGTQGVETAKAKCGALIQAAHVQLTQMHDSAVATMATPAYAQQLRVNLAKLINGDPDMLAKAQQLAQINAQAAQALADVDRAAASGDATAGASAKSGTGIFGVVTLGALWAMLA